MKLIDPKQVSDVQGLRDLAETYKLSFESAISRAGELEFEVTDYKRAYGNMSLDRDGLRAQIVTLTARVLELEEMVAPEPVVVDAAVAVACPSVDSATEPTAEDLDRCPKAVPMQAPAEDVPTPPAEDSAPAPADQA